MSYCLNPVCSAPQNSADDVCQICGTALKLCDRYRALKPIGQGGFGRTFLAVDLSKSMKPRCVIKQLYPQQKGVEIQAKASDLFRQEAQQLLTAGQYPSIPKFLDYFEQESYQYLVQEFIEGQNLAEVLATGQTFTESEVTGLLETMLETVDFLHHHQIIHRDIKPANIIQTLNGRFVLVDLGAAKLMTGTALGQTGTVIGSAEYVAPEQLRGKAIFASDLYSLGATCVTLLTGISPFSLFDTSTGSWEWRDYLSAPVGDRLGKVLDRLLIGPTKQRYKSADEVLQELEQPSLVKESSIDLWQKEVLVETEENTAELGIDMMEAGEVVGRGGKVDRQNTQRLLKIMFSYLIGGSIMWPIGALIIANLSSKAPAPEAPVSLSHFQKQQPATPRIYNPNPDEVLISKYIKPTYLKPAKPVNTFRNIPPFKVFGLRSDNNTLVMGLPLDIIDSNGGGKFLINQLDMKTGLSQELTIPSPGTNSNFSQASAGTNSEQYESFLRNDNLIYGPFTKQHKPGLIKVFNLQINSFIPISNELTTKEGTMTLPIRRGRGSVVVDGDSYSIWKIFSDGNLVKFRAMTSGEIIVNNDLQQTIIAENAKMSSRLIDLSTENKGIDIMMNVPVLLKYDYYYALYGSELFKNKGRKLLISSRSESKLNDLLEVRKFMPTIYQKNIPIAYSKPIKFKDKSSAIYGLDADLNKLRYIIPRSGIISAPIVSPDGKTMFFIEQSSSIKLTVWDTLTGEFLREVNLIAMTWQAGAESVEFTTDGKKMVIAESNGVAYKGAETYISIWDVEELRNP